MGSSSYSGIDIDRAAQLSRLELAASERALVEEELVRILEWASRLPVGDAAGEASDVAPPAEALGLREDRPREPRPAERKHQPGDALAASEVERIAPRLREGLFVVPAVIRKR